MIDKLAVKIKAEEEPIPFWKLEKLCAKAIIDKINEIITELNIILQEREHYCKVYEEVVKPAMLPKKKPVNYMSQLEEQLVKDNKLLDITLIKQGKRFLVKPECDQCVANASIIELDSFSGRVSAAYCTHCKKFLKVLKEIK